ncbi:NAD(P)-dependent oxidoreductase [Virgisporangium aliadipatigenens]|uniref:NAD(P)-dependent oxidoreductase n=1 Tax=Virgisporangium aliadipatigenens TaxID=741659 RepID=A0A8J4DTE0_9ACTN|nr:SDR family oxidoreductase [Virgisporangium aliadipatigenens]GIJ48853.1 NAD(P)-dependent oxidoreductase [Virgisporangium aliadipatigenens]
MRVLVTGATGYVGGRLAPRLVHAGHRVRCLTRSPGKLRDVPWAKEVEIVEGDVTDAESLYAAFKGVEIVYYLVHSLGRRDFEELDRAAALNVAAAAAAAGVRRIVYLGGPDPDDNAGSAHLRSRHEVARILLEGEVPAVVLRAPVIIGSGSASFEMLRHLTERLPIMITPKWVHNRIQPIAIRDVLRYLVFMASDDDWPAREVNRAFDICGPDVLTYAEMMQRYARVARLPRRVILPTRFLSPTLSAHWVGVVTPVPNAIARPLVASLIHDATGHEHDIATYVPDPPEGLTGFDRAVALALAKIRDSDVETRWSGATWPGAMAAEPLPTDPEWSGGTLYTDNRQRPVATSPERLWRVIEAIGGENGWYSFPLAWSVRGWLDRLVGGVGLRRGRRDPHRLYVGEALDFWRVEEIVPGELLRLRAEMRLPGRAWLEMWVEPGPNGARYRQRAVFLPHGLAGHLYWAAVWPFHAVIFGGMARNIARTAERTAGAPLPAYPADRLRR